MKFAGRFPVLVAALALVAGTAATAVRAAPIHFDLDFGSRSGPGPGTLANTSLAEILTGQREDLFAQSNLQYASFSGIGVLGTGSVSQVGAMLQDGTDSYCVDWCRDISGKMFQGGTQSGSFALRWYFNNTLDLGTEFPPGSGSPVLKNVQAHPPLPASGGFPDFVVGYTPRSQFADLYSAQLTISDLTGQQVFAALFRSSDCTEAGKQCSAFQVTNNFEYLFSQPVDGLSMHFEGPAAGVSEPGGMASLAVAFAALLATRRRGRAALQPARAPHHPA